MKSGGHQPCTRCSTASGLGDTGHPRRTLSHYQVRKFPLSSTGNGVSAAGSKRRQSVVISHLREDVALLEARTRGASVRREPCPSGLVGCRGGLWSCQAARQAVLCHHVTAVSREVPPGSHKLITPCPFRVFNCSVYVICHFPADPFICSGRVLCAKFIFRQGG